MQIANAQQQPLISYDAAGNMTSDAYFSYASYEYDANGRAKSVTPYYSPTVKATYDALGQRVQTESTYNNQTYTTRYVYDLAGNIVAEYEQGQLKRERIYRSGSLLAIVEQTQQGEQVGYVMSDQQGSTRVVTNQSGQVTGRYDYTPFGNEIGASVGMRDTTQGYSQPTSVKQGYALTENDTDSLKHTWFRKLDSKQGRFTSPDPYNGSMSIANPQSFNRYAYTQNDPVNFVDPSGLNMSVILIYGVRCHEPEGCQNVIVGVIYVDSPGGGGGDRGDGGGGGGDPQRPRLEQQQPKCNPNFFNDEQTSSRTQNGYSFSGADLNIAARAVYGEAAGSGKGGTDEERDAIASVLYNRIGQRGYTGGVQTTFRGVAFAGSGRSSQFRAVTGPPSETRKFRNSAPGSFQNLNPAECEDLRRSIDAIERLIRTGPRFDYTFNLGGTSGPGTVIGGSRFGYSEGLR